MDEIHFEELYHQWGHAGQHHGIGTDDCPRKLHHHHDQWCDPPPIVRLLHFLTGYRGFIRSAEWGSRRG